MIYWLVLGLLVYLGARVFSLALGWAWEEYQAIRKECE